MTPHLETLETVGEGIDKVRAKIVATRESLQAVLDRDIDVPEISQAVARLERVEAELDRIEGGIMVKEGLRWREPDDARTRPSGILDYL